MTVKLLTRDGELLHIDDRVPPFETPPDIVHWMDLWFVRCPSYDSEAEDIVSYVRAQIYQVPAREREPMSAA